MFNAVRKVLVLHNHVSSCCQCELISICTLSLVVAHLYFSTFAETMKQTINRMLIYYQLILCNLESTQHTKRVNVILTRSNWPINLVAVFKERGKK